MGRTGFDPRTRNPPKGQRGLVPFVEYPFLWDRDPRGHTLDTGGKGSNLVVPSDWTGGSYRATCTWLQGSTGTGTRRPGTSRSWLTSTLPRHTGKGKPTPQTPGSSPSPNSRGRVVVVVLGRRLGPRTGSGPGRG